MKNNNYPIINNGLVGIYNYEQIIKMQSQTPVVIISRKQRNQEQQEGNIQRKLYKKRTTNK